MDKNELRYMLSKQTTNMDYISTSYGNINLCGDWELEYAVAEAITKVIKKRIAKEDQIDWLKEDDKRGFFDELTKKD